MSRAAPAMKVENFWYVGAYEQNYANYDLEARLREYLDWQPDILVIAIGENIENLDTPVKQAAFAKSFTAILEAFKMYNRDGNDGLCLLATSPDGVHWEDQGPVINDRARADGATFFKCFVGKCGDKFILDHGEFSGLRAWTMSFSK